eukprot:m.52646 g.52646  ORF g.52646 m.52646 type:complete len:60 (+) comp11322_c0_seq3:3510-3689(+)
MLLMLATTAMALLMMEKKLLQFQYRTEKCTEQQLALPSTANLDASSPAVHVDVHSASAT